MRVTTPLLREKHELLQAGQWRQGVKPLLPPPTSWDPGPVLLVLLCFGQVGGKCLGEVGVAAAKQKEWLGLEEFQEVVFPPREVQASKGKAEGGKL